MAQGLGEDVRTKKKSLTPQQHLFMKALQEAIAKWNAPVSVDQIRIQLEKSDSRVRSHIKILMRRGYVCCVGKARVKRYVPSMLWLEEIDQDEAFDELELPCVGGGCEKPGCSKLAEDYWRDGYYCRDCIMGHDAESDALDIRRQYIMRLSPPSSAGLLLEQVWPTYNEDMLEEIVKEDMPASKVRVSSKRVKKKRRR